MPADTASFDFVVVGAGSAGCALARRLAESGRTVALLEAGPAANRAPPRRGSGPRA